MTGFIGFCQDKIQGHFKDISRTKLQNSRTFFYLYVIYATLDCVCRLYNIDCAVMHPKGKNNFVKKVQKHKIQDGGMFTGKFKMAAILSMFIMPGIPV